MEGTYVYRRLIDVDIWQKLTQHCKRIILQLKINIYFFKFKDIQRNELVPVFINVKVIGLLAAETSI